MWFSWLCDDDHTGLLHTSINPHAAEVRDTSAVICYGKLNKPVSALLYVRVVLL